MRNFFDVDGPFISGLTKVADIFILNLLLIICSIPVFTFGAAYTAMYYVTLKMVKDEECYTLKSFFKSFKQNFKQATGIWLIMLVIGMVLFFDLRIMNGEFSGYLSLNEGVLRVMSVLLMAGFVVYTFVFSYVFPVLSKFDNTVKNTIRNALIMSIRHLPLTVAIIIINVLPLALMYFVPRALILMFVIFGLSAYCNSYMFVKIFKNYMPEEEIKSDEEFEVVMDDNIESKG